MMRFYYTLLNLQIPHCWVAIGKTPPPDFIKGKQSVFMLQVKDDWDIYSDSAKCDPLIKHQIAQIVKDQKVTSVFLPLEYHYAPYILDLKLPQFYISHLLHGPLIQSVLKLPYAELIEVQKELHADRVRLQIEAKTILQSEYFVGSSEKVLQDLKEHYSIAPTCILQNSKLGTEKALWEHVKYSNNGESLFFGRISHQKGLLNLLKGTTKKLSVLGKGKLAPLLNTKPDIRVLEWADTQNLRDHLDDYQFCVFPSHYEPWGLSLTEALASGKICLAQKDVSGHELQINHGVNGFLVDFKTKSLEEIISELNFTETELEQVAFNARSTAHEIQPHILFIEKAVSDFFYRNPRTVSKL